MIPISEIKYSISGEGQTAGYPVIIVRTAGCNLPPCTYCDTQYAYKTEQGTLMDAKEIYSRCLDIKFCKKVLLTGGEPLWHDVGYLCELLIDDGYEVEIETNGSIDIDSQYLPEGVVFSLDIKTPSSGNSNSNYYRNLKNLHANDQVKFVIGDRNDFNFALNVLNSYRISSYIMFSPVWGKLDPKVLAEWIMNYWPDSRLSLQLHKVIGVA